MDYRTIQRIARGVVESSSACDGQFYTGTVSSTNPLKIKLGEESGGIELDGDDIILTQSVVSKKLYINKHTHEENDQLVDAQGVTSVGPVTFLPAGANIPLKEDGTPDMSQISGGTTLALNHTHTNATSTIEAWVTEDGYKLPVDPSTYDQGGERVIITINRGLEKDDRVIMTRVSCGQQFIVLSRNFETDKHGEDDE